MTHKYFFLFYEAGVKDRNWLCESQRHQRLEAAATVHNRILYHLTPESIRKQLFRGFALGSRAICNQRQTTQAHHSNTNLQKLQMKGGRLERFKGHLAINPIPCLIRRVKSNLINIQNSKLKACYTYTLTPTSKVPGLD